MAKRFIAGAVCPHCGETDSLALWREHKIDTVECVKCGHQMREADKQVRGKLKHDGQIIGVFTPE
ncbi:YheV family putative zinc ribbon protein [Tatumella saanichensis]|uniref:YheV family putative zinc ribbon protein n=1 Tax=Tatumella saanichensis TaxID=480813 RepID=UPI0004A32FF7|nr:YheV family putative zinc ribbon protein [Tatumella saanichensis]